MSASSCRASASSPTASDPTGAGDSESGGGTDEPAIPPQPPGAGGRRRTPLLIACALGLLLALDLSRDPSEQWSARALLGAVSVYQATLSPVLGAVGVRCRFVPSCSHYAADAIRQDGALNGSLRAIWRVLRCGPWTPAGTVDAP